MSSSMPTSLPATSSVTASGMTSAVVTVASAAAQAAAATESPSHGTRTSPAATTSTPAAAVAATANHHAHHGSPPPLQSSVPTEHKFDVGSATTSKGKRVFVFQKRWLHTLPIIEKTLSEPALDSSSGAKTLSNGGTADDAAATASHSHSPTASGEHSSRDVIACMLCDEPGASHSIAKMWSRLNCRRGRIENHLTSKHPEFMLLLKHKRDTEGELAVQLFLQGMRDGRCSIRNEITLGLYTHMQSLHTHASTVTTAADTSASTAATYTGASSNSGLAALVPDSSVAVDLKRGFPAASVYTVGRESASTKTPTLQLPVFPPPPTLVSGAATGVSKTTLELLELEHRRKRARLATPPTLADDATLAAGGSSAQNGASEASGATAASSLEASVLAQWHSVFYDRLVVVTGGDNEFIAGLATTLWLLGANVLLTFATLSALEEFTTSHVARFPDAAAADTPSSASPRGVLLSMLCSFQTRQQIDDWSRSVADKFARVDFLINFVDEDGGTSSGSGSDRRKSTSTESVTDASLDDPHDHATSSSTSSTSSVGGASGEFLVSSANQLLELCQSISTLCFQSTGAIVNITTQSDDVRRNMNCAAVESMTKSLARELQPLHVQVNCILLQQLSGSAGSTTVSSASQEQQQQQQQQPPLPTPADALRSPQSAAQDQQSAALSHTILFLLSPTSACVSGSVLRLQHRVSESVASVGSNSSTVAAAGAIRDDPVVAAAATPAPMAEANTGTLDHEEDRDRVNQIV